MAGKLILVRTGNRALASRALEAGFTQFLVNGHGEVPGRADVYRVGDDGHILHAGRKVGRYIRIENREDEHRVRALKGKVALVVVEPRNWKVIPLENLLAALGGKTKLVAVAKDAKEAKLFLETLEKGVDGVVIEPRTARDLATYRPLLDAPRPPLRLQAARITRLEPLGLGERVCVDTVNLFEHGEGLLIGSSSEAFFLVAAETHETEYVAARPFRVNAGAVHAYVRTGETTKYLSELRAGTGLEAVDAKGARRPVIVGRAKIERRPLVLIEAELRRRRANVILQNAETIRLVQPNGRAKSVSRLRVGDEVLVFPDPGARHFGMKVEETIREL